MQSELYELEQDLFSSVTPIVESEEVDDARLYAEITERGFQSDPSRFLLKNEALLLQLAYSYNKILSLSNSRTRILAHQVESTHRIVNSLNHRILLADEVGLGKTVEAGLVIKELIYRHNYKRILIVCPASLLYQWQNEMRSKFNEEFMIMDRNLYKKTVKAVKNKNPWNEHGKILCSIDFIKSKSFYDDMMRTDWDAVIFDEAHRLRRDSKHSTQAYTTAEIICARTRALLLLSATPFRGKLEELYFLIHLVDKNILGPFNSFYNEYCIDTSSASNLRQKLSSVIIRRTKKEVGGFTIRRAKTIRFDLYYDEMELYTQTTRYVAEEFNRAIQSENRALGFVMTVFQKLLDSSTHALYSALKKRTARLEEMLEKNNSSVSKTINEDELNEDDIDDIDGMEDATVRKTREETEAEIRTLKGLITLASNIDKDKKGEKLLELIDIRMKRGDKKILIFTQFKTTQDYLKDLLSDYVIEVFNGSMSGDEKEDAISRFKNDSQILIATEAGGEGRNLQFCNIVINYDLPWSPLKIEQRIGRLHRFGQKKEVHIYNFSTKGTVAERVLEVLDGKIKIFEDSIGTPDILLGEMEDELNLNQLFMDLASGRRKGKDVELEIENRLETARINYEKLADLTVAERLDFNYDEYYKITMKERNFSNIRIENFIRKLAEADPSAKEIISENGKKGLYKVVMPGVTKPVLGSFSSEKALDDERLEFLAFGHPAVDGLISSCGMDEFGGLTGCVSIDHPKKFHGMIFNYLARFVSAEETREFISVFVDGTGILDRFEIEDLELFFSDIDNFKILSGVSSGIIREVSENISSYFSKAQIKIREKVKQRIYDLSGDIDLHIDPEIEKIKISYDRSIAELEHKLDLQQGQMKWYGKDMKSAITRTRNSIIKQNRDKQNLLDKYRGYAGIKSSVTLVSAGVVSSEK